MPDGLVAVVNVSSSRWYGGTGGAGEAQIIRRLALRRPLPHEILRRPDDSF
jgi:hypothetical protein